MFSSAEKLRSRGFTYYACFLAQSLSSVKLLMIAFSENSNLMPLNLFLLIVHHIPRWWQYYCSFIFILVSSLCLNCIYRMHNNFYLFIPWNEAQKTKYQPDKRMTKYYTIIGCLMRHEFGLGSYDSLVSFSATQMQTLQAKKRDDIVSNRSNSYKTKTPAERTTFTLQLW